ncbi:MAG: type II toxin-antitoxin system HicA family toxin [Myxococcota bacterium]
MDSREVLKRLKKDGWYKVGQSGDHLQFKHDEVQVSAMKICSERSWIKRWPSRTRIT